MKRILSLMLLVPAAAYAMSACTKNADDEPDGGAGDNGGGGDGENPDGPSTPGDVNPDDLKKNPIEGAAPAKQVVEIGAFTDGPVWHAKLGVLFFTTPLGEGALFRMLPDGRVMKVRDGVLAQGTQPIGNTVDPKGSLITVEAKRVSRTAFDAKSMPMAPTVIATGYSGGAAPPPDPQPQDATDAGTAPPPPPPSTPGAFDTLNDVTARKDGTLYVTDPGYFTTPAANRIYRIDPTGKVQVVEAFEDVPRPNGIALSPDEKYLYVGFSQPVKGTLPFVRQYIVNKDGTLGEWIKFIDVGPEESSPDGITVDLAGNVYIATKAGIEVYRNDSSKIGVLKVPEKATGISFGGKDMKSLYITTEGTKIWEVRLNVPGMAQ